MDFKSLFSFEINPQFWHNVIHLIGVMFLATIAVNIFKTILNLTFWNAYDLKTDKKDQWAVVTGASDGIGKEFALQLAIKGYNVVLLARSEDKMNDIASKIKKLGYESIVYKFDFANAGDKDWEKLADKLNSLDVKVLVNNVGVSHDFPVSFLEEDTERIERIMQVNVHSLMKMCRIVIPHMVEKKKGLVLNMGSMSGKIPSGLLSTYAASKAFVSSFSQGLAMEVHKQGVHVEHVNLYFVQTAMSKIRKSSFFVPTPRKFVASVLHSCGSSINSTPYAPHALINFVLDWFVPETFKIDSSYTMHQEIRERALKKKLREAKKDQ
ncbi:hypothetical protein HDV06_005471 [Boothiomyces sp. JEL0866]|nr:hypothetical protein HDV06_005471 [Boothiomyces sp. JEL0866]